jgi:GNAT superfamily N-acetyltransferase
LGILLGKTGKSVNKEISVQQATGQEDREAIIRLFEGIALAEGWQPNGELRSHQERSVYFGVWDGELLAGGLQLVTPDTENRLPTHAVWPELESVENGSSVLHAAVLALLPEYRGKDHGAMFWNLGVELWRYCIKNEVKTLWLEATPKTMRGYKLLGWPLVIQGELRTHWGEPCYPCTLSVREVAGSLTERAFSSEVYRNVLLSMIAPSLNSVTAS